MYLVTIGPVEGADTVYDNGPHQNVYDVVFTDESAFQAFMRIYGTPAGLGEYI